MRLTVTEGAREAIATAAEQRCMGARGLRSLLEAMLLEAQFEAPAHPGCEIVLDAPGAVPLAPRFCCLFFFCYSLRFLCCFAAEQRCTGARGLRSLLEAMLLEAQFEAPAHPGCEIVLDAPGAAPLAPRFSCLFFFCYYLRFFCCFVAARAWPPAACARCWRRRSMLFSDQIASL